MTGSALVARLEQFRRRESLVTAVGLAGHAVLGATAAALVAARFVDPRLAIVGGAGAAALVTVALATVRRQSLPRIASAVDRHAGLDDRLLTALEHHTESDAMAHLLIRDATARAHAVAPADVFPFRMPSRLAWTAAAAAAAAILFTVLAPQPAARTATRPARQGEQDGATSDPPQRGTPANPADRTPAETPPAPNQRRADAPRAADPLPGATRRAAAIPPGASGVAPDGRLGARAEGPGAAARTEGAGALVAQPGAPRSGVPNPAGASTAPRTITLSSTAAPAGQRPVPAGRRAYVRSYFEAIGK